MDGIEITHICLYPVLRFRVDYQKENWAVFVFVFSDHCVSRHFFWILCFSCLTRTSHARDSQICFDICSYFFAFFLFPTLRKRKRKRYQNIYVYNQSDEKRNVEQKFNDCHWPFIWDRLCPSESKLIEQIKYKATGKAFPFMHLFVSFIFLLVTASPRVFEIKWSDETNAYPSTSSSSFFCLYGRLVTLPLDAF